MYLADEVSTGQAEVPLMVLNALNVRLSAVIGRFPAHDHRH